MDVMLQLSEPTSVTPDEPARDAARPALLRTLQATSTRRALLLTALGGLLIAGVIIALPIGGNGRLAGYAGSDSRAGIGFKGSAAFANDQYRVTRLAQTAGEGGDLGGIGKFSRLRQ